MAVNVSTLFHTPLEEDWAVFMAAAGGGREGGGEVEGVGEEEETDPPMYMRGLG